MRLKQGNGAFAGERIVDGMRKKRFCAWLCLLLAALLLSACASGEPARVTAAPTQRLTDARDDAQTEEDAMMKMNVQSARASSPRRSNATRRWRRWWKCCGKRP